MESRSLSRRERVVHLLGILFFVAVVVFGVLCIADVITLHNASTGQVEHHTLTRIVFGGIYVVIGLGGAGGFAAALYAALRPTRTPHPTPTTTEPTALDIADPAWDGFH